MKRLTFDGDFCDIAMCREELGGPFCEEGYCSQRKVWERLKAYEDTGLEPDNITREFDETTILQLAGSVLGMSIDRLRELAKADREGRCVVLPVKLHDKLYYVDKEQVRETEVESIHNWTSGRWKLSTHTDRQSTHWIGYEVDFDGIGKTVFLTREEAEAALREATE